MYRKFARTSVIVFFFARVENNIENFENRVKYRQNEIYLRKRNNTERFRRYSFTGWKPNTCRAVRPICGTVSNPTQWGLKCKKKKGKLFAFRRMGGYLSRSR